MVYEVHRQKPGGYQERFRVNCIIERYNMLYKLSRNSPEKFHPIVKTNCESEVDVVKSIGLPGVFSEHHSRWPVLSSSHFHSVGKSHDTSSHSTTLLYERTDSHISCLLHVDSPLVPRGLSKAAQRRESPAEHSSHTARLRHRRGQHAGRIHNA